MPSATLRTRSQLRSALAVAGLLAVAAAVPLTRARADIPWPEIEERLHRENAALARRPQGRDGEYAVVCTLYYTPKESGFTTGRGFDTTPETRPGLRGRSYGRDFLAAVKQEGFGRLREPVGGRDYLRYLGGNAYGYASRVVGRGSEKLVPRLSCAVRGTGLQDLRPGAELKIANAELREVFRHERWRVADTGGGLRRWQVDLYWGEDEPRGPGKEMARPRNSEFEYACALVKVGPVRPDARSG